MRVGVLGVVTMVVSLMGCGSFLEGLTGSPPEEEEDDHAIDGDDGGFVGGTSGGTGASGGGGVSGAGMGGSAGTASCAQPLTSFNIGCNAVAMLERHCAQGGCHNATIRAGRLDLTPDDFLVARVLDVPATMGVAQAGLLCTPATCSAPGSALLIDSNDHRASYMLQKMEAFVPDSRMDVDVGCGTAMPMWASPATGIYTLAASSCLESLFLTIAALGTPCTLPGQVPAERLPPCP